MTILDALLAIHAYPLDPEAVRLKAVGRGLLPDNDFCACDSSDRAYMLARADVLMMIAYAPNVTQEGVSYSIPDTARQRLEKEAERIYRSLLDPSDPLYPKTKPRYGYRGSLLKG